MKQAYAVEHSANEITERLNVVYGKLSSKLDHQVQAAALSVVRRDKW